MKWSAETVQVLVDAISESPSIDAGLREASLRLGETVGYAAAVGALQRARKPPMHELVGSAEAPAHPYSGLVDAVRKFPDGVTLEGLCDVLDMSPSRVRTLIDEARAHGVLVDIASDRVMLRGPELASGCAAVDVAAPQPVRGLHRIGVFSDLHFGSDYCLASQFEEFVRYAVAQGVRDFFCPGDIVEGCYRHAAFERSHESQEAQHRAFLERLPSGVRVFFIDGNHDHTWTERTGLESGRAMARLAAERSGGAELHFLGSRGAMVDYGGTKIELWHPKSSLGFATSYKVQCKIRDTAADRLPHILLVGHWHRFGHVRQQGVHAFLCPTFQHGDSAFGRSLGGDVDCGGLILEWSVDGLGGIGAMACAFHSVRHAGQGVRTIRPAA